ncbi:MAG: hypothetical protein JKX98_06150 [Alcanivoracaceae bacterium]|nr:hypothetical protein [Alcanivoracaceae bacterium]
MKKKLFIIDGYAFIFRAFFVCPEILTSEKLDVGAIQGFIQIFFNLIDKCKMKNIIVALDHGSSKNTYRHEIYPEYKANRSPVPQSLIQQFPIMREVLDAFGIRYVEKYGSEADDLIGTLASHYQTKGHSINVISADKDLAQLIGENDTWWDYGKSKPLNPTHIYQKFGVYPDQIADYLALTGDSIDNIPGVPGIGAKTAAILLNHFETLDALIARKQEITYLSFRGAKSCKKKIENHINELYLARKLTRIVRDIPINNFDIKRKNIDLEKMHIIFDYLNFGPLLRRRILEIGDI